MESALEEAVTVAQIDKDHYNQVAKEVSKHNRAVVSAEDLIPPSQASLESEELERVGAEPSDKEPPEMFANIFGKTTRVSDNKLSLGTLLERLKRKVKPGQQLVPK